MDRSAKLAPADGADAASFSATFGTIQHLLRGNTAAVMVPAAPAQAQAPAAGENIIPFAPTAEGEGQGAPSDDSWVDTLTAITHVADTVRATEEQAAQLEARTEKLVGIALEQLSKAETRIVNVELRLEETQGSLRSAEMRCADLEARLREAEARASQAGIRLEDAEDRARKAEGLHRTTEVRAIDAECALELAHERVRVAESRCLEAEQWRDRIHEAVATHFPAAVAQWQASTLRARGPAPKSHANTPHAGMPHAPMARAAS